MIKKGNSQMRKINLIIKNVKRCKIFSLKKKRKKKMGTCPAQLIFDAFGFPVILFISSIK